MSMHPAVLYLCPWARLLMYSNCLLVNFSFITQSVTKNLDFKTFHYAQDDGERKLYKNFNKS